MTLAGPLADASGRALTALARALDRAFARLGVAPPRLDIPPEVAADLRGLFGDAVDPHAVVVRRGHVPGIPHPRAFALPGLIYLGADPGVVRTDRAYATPTLVHEFAHLWQGRVLGPRYVPLALLEQARHGARAYDWRAFLARAGGVGDHVVDLGLPLEAHAQLVADAYARRHGRAPHTPAEGRAMDEALAGLLAAAPPPAAVGARHLARRVTPSARRLLRRRG